jgi:hypothetical protein
LSSTRSFLQFCLGFCCPDASATSLSDADQPLKRRPRDSEVSGCRNVAPLSYSDWGCDALPVSQTLLIMWRRAWIVLSWDRLQPRCCCLCPADTTRLPRQALISGSSPARPPPAQCLELRSRRPSISQPTRTFSETIGLSRKLTVVRRVCAGRQEG